MDPSANPFIVLSYVGGPAVLTNACSLIIMSTSNRLGRAIDRSRFLTNALSEGASEHWKGLYVEELAEVGARVVLIGRALIALYVATAMFGLATLLALSGAVLATFFQGLVFDVVVTGAVAFGSVGFLSFVTGAFALVLESRMTIRALKREAETARAVARGTPNRSAAG